MAYWERSTFGAAAAESLVEAGYMPAVTDAGEWLIPDDEAVPAPPPGYVVSFGGFHERGLAAPGNLFFRGLLHHYGMEMQDLTPNNILQISAFIMLCEGFLEVGPHFELLP